MPSGCSNAPIVLSTARAKPLLFFLKSRVILRSPSGVANDFVFSNVMENLFLTWLAAFLVIYVTWKLIRSYSILPKIHERNVLITGCDRGLGKLLAIDLDAKGVPVYAGCLLEKSIQELKDCCSSRLKPLKLDVSDENSILEAKNFVANDLGKKALWAVVNNAGIPGPCVPFEWTTRNDCRKVLEVNLIGMYDVILKFLPLIRRGKQGRIVNMSSDAGRIAFVAAPYQMSKFGVEALSEGLNFDLEPFNISVHVLEPSMFKTAIMGPEMQVQGLPAYIKQTSDEVKQAYGGQEYIENYTRSRIEALQHMASEKTYLVVEAYEHALFARYPQSRYQVGFGSRYFTVPLSLLPLPCQMLAAKLAVRAMGLQRVYSNATVKR